MPWSDVQRETFYWACGFAPELADAILQRDGDEAAQLPLLRKAWARRCEAEPEWADAEKAYHLAGSLLAGDWLNASEVMRIVVPADDVELEEHDAVVERKPQARKGVRPAPKTKEKAAFFGNLS